ncbi:hypothetical protein LOTGIDRAFT_179268 [Lottia gigantea]|uniref:U11/U12 small nuclear ribonucleoprotein 35 kDa protein n=1 Tax=Lottia gigantea TaxID=225164 RepID=V3Z9J3_LOTGI|nr:hypothetical protein LOTGIDRAFT_179268 [Lottia gigantea]ESO87593.1 hypothetical protein LOTGIDRAFT_179268 [Lottia gigantea]
MDNSWSPFVKKKYNPLQVGSIDGTDTADIHDNGIVRALDAKYKSNKKVIGNPESTLFIARLSKKTDEDTIMKAFKKYGPIKHCRLIRDIVTGFSKCYAFLEFDNEDTALTAFNSTSYNLILDGHEVLVDRECERVLEGWVPRRLGGGFGGKKESGQLRFGCKDRPFRKPYSLERKEKEFRGRTENSYSRNKEQSYNRRYDK